MGNLFVKGFEDDFTITMFQKMVLSNGDARSVTLDEINKFMDLFCERLEENGITVKNDLSDCGTAAYFLDKYADKIVFDEKTKTITLADGMGFDRFTKSFTMGALPWDVFYIMLQDHDIGRKVFDAKVVTLYDEDYDEKKHPIKAELNAKNVQPTVAKAESTPTNTTRDGKD